MDELVERVEALLGAGWKRVRLVTDHGWLLVPGGLPKTDLPSCLVAEAKWGRCAALKPDAQSPGRVVPWHWHDGVRVALGPGVSCFYAGMDYAHGGLSVQECVVPVITVARTADAGDVTIEEVAWRGLVCRVRAAGAAAGVVADLRAKAGAAGSSVAGGGKALDAEGTAALFVDDDALEGTAAFLVLLRDGRLVAQRVTTIGASG